jgi:hypothetical protein
MASCDVCGNDYDNAFTVRTAGGGEFTFDSIECARTASHRPVRTAADACWATVSRPATRRTAARTAPATRAPRASPTGPE